MLRLVENLEPLTVPEQKLLEAVQSRSICDFLGADEGDRGAHEMADWGEGRRVRAAAIRLRTCRIDGRVDFAEAT